MSSNGTMLSALPDRIARLRELAYNLWWSWNPDARGLFRRLDPFLWDRLDENPVLMLSQVAPERMTWAVGDGAFTSDYDRVMARLDNYLAFADDTWVSKNAPQLKDKTVAYFSAEFGLYRSLPIYSGGLGVLAGDHIKEASDLGLPLVAISLLYRQGFLSQRLSSDGWQQDVPAKVEPNSEPTEQMCDENGVPIMVELALDDEKHPIKLAIWRVQVGRVPLYLLDSDVEGNPEWTRTVSSRLYGGDTQHRLRQELILGIGGIRALRALGYDPAYFHANEGHAAFSLLERLREHIAAGATLDEAQRRVRGSSVFTSHTPVPAGHDKFPREMMDRFFDHYWPQIGMDRDAFYALGAHGDGTDFNMTAIAMRLADHRNGVSKIHGRVTREMWADLWPGTPVDEVPITSVTNGVHLPTWISSRMARMLDQHIGRDWRERQSDPEVWARVMDIPDDVFWAAHGARKRRMIDVLSERSRKKWITASYDAQQVLSAGPFLEANVLTIGFARRFATYKRATLLFHDPDRLAKILNDQDRPVQIVFSGKAHPADDGGKHMIREIIWRSRDPRFGGRIAFAEDYDMGVAALLVSGVDVWMNNPRAPLEASGTSGMKAAANGVPNLSILDGWWDEGWQEQPINGWGIEPSPLTGWEQDNADANTLYDVIERQVAPLYYDRDDDGRPRKWIKVAKTAMATNAPEFSARRMVLDYIANLYTPAATATATAITSEPALIT